MYTLFLSPRTVGKYMRKKRRRRLVFRLALVHSNLSPTVGRDTSARALGEDRLMGKKDRAWCADYSSGKGSGKGVWRCAGGKSVYNGMLTGFFPEWV